MNMKKLTAAAVCGIIAASFAACSNNNTSVVVPESDSVAVPAATPAPELNSADPTSPGETSMQQHREGDLGDVNEDGNVSLTDAFLLLQYIEEPDKYPLSDKALDNADVVERGNGIDMDDYDAITSYYTGEIPELPVSVMEDADSADNSDAATETNAATEAESAAADETTTNAE